MAEPQKDDDRGEEDARSDRSSGPDFRQRKRRKNLMMLAALVGFIILIYFVALARMGGL